MSHPTLETLDDWCRAHGYPDLPEQSLGGIHRVVGAERGRWYERQTVREALQHDGWLGEHVPRILVAFHARQAELRAWVDEALALPLPPPLDDVREALRPFLVPVVTDWLQVRVVDFGILELHHRDLSVLRIDPRDVRLDAVLNDPRVGSAAVQALLALHGQPGRELLQVLERPLWRHLLDELPEAGATHALGWRLAVGRHGVERIRPVCVTTDARGRLRTRLAKGSEVSPAALSHPGDAAASRAAVPEALAALVGHPRVFLGTAHQPVPVTRVSWCLWLGVSEGLIRPEIQLDGAPASPRELEQLVRLSDTGIAVVVDPEGVRIVRVAPSAVALLNRVVQGHFPEVPVEHAEALLSRVPELAERVRVAVSDELAGRTLEPDPRPRIRLQRTESGLRLSAWAQPLADGESFPPGEGPEQLFTRLDGERATVRRALAGEPEAMRDALAVLSLQGARRVGAFAWMLTPQQGAAAIATLASLPESFRVTWDGRPLRVRRAAGDALTVRVRSVDEWLSLEGGLRLGRTWIPVDEMLAATRGGESFLPLSDEDWVALDEDLRDALVAVARSVDGRGRLGPLAAGLLEGLEGAGARLEGDAEWRQRRVRLRASAELTGEPPEGLQATLRPYQAEGLRWLIRLAHWAPGGVLADDMGLGKTVQALALALDRAAGPTLVVAPTSVGFGWAAEAARFAPSLRVVSYRGPSRSLDALGPGSLVVTSWTLLARDAEALAAIDWHTVVLDEAQAVKNPDTRRARAARALGGVFTLALTGTPVENRALDLWSILRVTCPGLLPGRRRFTEQLGGQSGEQSARAALAKLVAPFVLRRTKSEVARELPARSEIVVPITLAEDERRLYDQVRATALEQLRTGAGGLGVLQALTRLRLAACHPRLIERDSEVPSSKSTWLRAQLVGLVEGGHRALVFSQFVQHLHLVREALADTGLQLRYLDGSTSVDARRAEVEAFQAGSGDVFLISLKAGGTGLNLTAADYVFHVDPWWNPAVEDQATDRAHRIGQTQPVTVCRLIAEHTIEERIVALHAEKRDLAEGLLREAGSTSALSAEDLLALLTGPRA